MHLKSLFVSNFRNLDQQIVEFNPELNFIIGKNAQGKTSLLESIYYISHGKSFRTSKTRDLINWDEDEVYLKAELAKQISNDQIEIQLGQGNREIKINSNKVPSISDLLGVFKTVCFTPEDLDLIRGVPGTRRQFIDRHLVDLDSSSLNNLVNYNKALKSKNLLLKQSSISEKQIQPWNQILADNAEVIVKKREELSKKLESAANSIYSEFASADGEIKLNWKSSFSNLKEVSSSAILERINKNFAKEQIIQSCLEGPHRDELLIELDNTLARNFASQGQTRSIALALKLAIVELIETEIKERPVVLLDDLDSELDRSRANQFYKLLFSKKRQIFLTGTEVRNQIADEKNAKILVIEKGKISA